MEWKAPRIGARSSRAREEGQEQPDVRQADSCDGWCLEVLDLHIDVHHHVRPSSVGSEDQRADHLGQSPSHRYMWSVRWTDHPPRSFPLVSKPEQPSREHTQKDHRSHTKPKANKEGGGTYQVWPDRPSCTSRRKLRWGPSPAWDGWKTRRHSLTQPSG